jgi:RNA polymerase sigma-70 factor (ECF subfamily)
MSPGETSDEQLILRISGGDREAVRLLYERHGRLVYGCALQIVSDAAAAEEVCQDVFLRVWERSGTYQADKGKVVTWLARIARNRAIDVLRARRARGMAPTAPADDSVSAPAGSGADPGERLWQSLRDERVREAVAALPSEQRRALTLAFFRGLTHRQIAEVLDEPLGTVKTRIRDAMLKLRAQLGEREGI